MDEFTDEQINILDDMVDHFAEKDRHNELRSEWNYSEEMIDAFCELYTTIKDEYRKRRFRR